MSWCRISRAESSPSPVMLQEGSTCTKPTLVKSVRTNVGYDILKLLFIEIVFHGSVRQGEDGETCLKTAVAVMIPSTGGVVEDCL